MSAKDLYHDAVKNALVNDSWEITHDPLRVPWRKTRTLQIDLGARMLIAAVKDARKIAVEIKSFLGISDLDDLYKAVGQFTVYRLALQKVEPDRELFLAIHHEAYQEHFSDEWGESFRQQANLKLVVFDKQTEEILKWIP